MKKLLSLGLLASLGAAAHAVSLTLEVDLTGVESDGSYGAAENWTNEIDLDAYFGQDYMNYTITGFSFDVDYSTQGDSWLSEVIFSVEQIDASDWYDTRLFPGQIVGGNAVLDNAGVFGLPAPGTGPGPFGQGAPFTVDPGDTIRALVYESFNDPGVDGSFEDDSKAYIRFDAEPVPEPGTMAALGLGIAAVLRRRKK